MKRPIVFAVVAIVAILAVVVVRRWDRSGPIARAQRILRDDKRFTNGPTAGNTFADLSSRILRDARSCERHHGKTDTRCRARYSAAAYTSVTAAAVLDCTQPGVYEARRAASAQLDGIVLVDRHPKRPPPEVPKVPQCS